MIRTLQDLLEFCEMRFVGVPDNVKSGLKTTFVPEKGLSDADLNRLEKELGIRGGLDGVLEHISFGLHFTLSGFDLHSAPPSSYTSWMIQSNQDYDSEVRARLSDAFPGCPFTRLGLYTTIGDELGILSHREKRIVTLDFETPTRIAYWASDFSSFILCAANMEAWTLGQADSTFCTRFGLPLKNASAFFEMICEACNLREDEFGSWAEHLEMLINEG